MIENESIVHNGWNDYLIKDWNDFIRCIGDLNITNLGPERYVFRGQSNKEWKLKPSILRLFEKFTPFENEMMGFSEKELPLSEARAIEYEVWKQFKFRMHLKLPFNIIDRDTEEPYWWPIMQHYSCPTRLLDWSFSPYIAAYFAVVDSEDVDGAIWFFYTNELRIRYKCTYDKFDQTMLFSKDKQVFLFNNDFATERSEIQQGVFTFSPYIMGYHCDMLSGMFGESNQELNRFIIPKSQKNEFLSRLQMMNITATTLFPGIDGLGRSLAEYVKLAVYRYSSYQRGY